MSVQGGSKKIHWLDTSSSPLNGQTEEPHSGEARGRRPVVFTLFVSETDLTTELEMTPLRLASKRGFSKQNACLERALTLEVDALMTLKLENDPQVDPGIFDATKKLL
ncbi:hypothetical protein L596_025485 [Steinernema carpocapsae]|uniref:Uncharacterized protein n=1 Tax=Steinernema carpocapsae TaxID=34508 RepID=A0A4U5M7W2_STECR|nr:hypothetical protein L596_025485 [Steinernema carpocapsae]